MLNDGVVFWYVFLVFDGLWFGEGEKWRINEEVMLFRFLFEVWVWL